MAQEETRGRGRVDSRTLQVDNSHGGHNPMLFLKQVLNYFREKRHFGFTVFWIWVKMRGLFVAVFRETGENSKLSARCLRENVVWLGLRSFM